MDFWMYLQGMSTVSTLTGLQGAGNGAWRPQTPQMQRHWQGKPWTNTVQILYTVRPSRSQRKSAPNNKR